MTLVSCPLTADYWLARGARGAAPCRPHDERGGARPARAVVVLRRASCQARRRRCPVVEGQTRRVRPLLRSSAPARDARNSEGVAGWHRPNQRGHRSRLRYGRGRSGVGAGGRDAVDSGIRSPSVGDCRGELDVSTVPAAGPGDAGKHRGAHVASGTKRTRPPGAGVARQSSRPTPPTSSRPTGGPYC